MITRPLPADTDLLDLHRLDPKRYPMLLESAVGGSPRARWDMLLASDGTGVIQQPGQQARRLDGDVLGPGFLAALDGEFRRLQRPREHESLPFRGGWGLFLAYELAAQVEPRLRLPAPPAPLPVALALRSPAAVLHDRFSGEVLSVAEGDQSAWLERIATDARRARELPAMDPWQPPETVEEDAPERYLEGVSRILDYLEAGDVFQVNLSRAWRARFRHPPQPADLYRRLREANPAPFAGLLVHDDWALASSSPERLVAIHGDLVQTRPIAGTRPRLAGDDAGERIQELVGHPKERAEHVMLIDLERNDLGRICAPGSVEVDELMAVESYTHVHHIVSNVRGRLRPGISPGQVVAAVFPGGTITGCPKVRCMEIVAELEGVGRGAYTGAMGYLNRDGDMDLNILIRTASLAGTALELRAGAGIVVDSDPQRELEESRAKARGLLRALGVE